MLPALPGIALFAAALPGAAQESFLPSRYTQDRYEAVAQTNPFVLEEEAKAPEEPPPWEFSLAGVSRIEGKYAVWLANTDGKAEPGDRYIRLVEGAQPNEKGMQLVSVKFDANPRELEAVVKRHTEQRAIKYDEKRLAPKPEAAPPVAANQRAGRQPNPQARNTQQGRAPTRAGNPAGNRGRQGANATPTRSRVIMPPGLSRGN